MARAYVRPPSHTLHQLERTQLVQALLTQTFDLFSNASNLGYQIFAKNRLRITGRCTDETCPVHNKPQES